MDEPLLARLKAVRQEHLVAFSGELDDAARRSLAAQIQGMDFELIARLGRGGPAQGGWAELGARALAPAAIRLADRTAERVQQARQRGLEALQAGELGVILVA